MCSASTRTTTSRTRSSPRSPSRRANGVGAARAPRGAAAPVVISPGGILGIDPGTTGMGYAVLDGGPDALRVAACGVVDAPRSGTGAQRLLAVALRLEELIRSHRPRAVAVERLFFNRNVRTAMAVAEARGVVLLSAARAGVPVFEYTPHEVKLAVTGYGAAQKRQVQDMLAVLLRLERPLRQDDAADAVAVAVCHAQRSRFDEAVARLG